MKRSLWFAALALLALTTGCNSCRPRLFNWGWFNRGDCCDSHVDSPVGAQCASCLDGHAMPQPGPAPGWVPPPRTGAGYPMEDLPAPGRGLVGPQG